MNIALILSGGTGMRMGMDIPKQYIEVNGQPILAYAMRAFEEHEAIDRIQIVADSVWHDYILKWTGEKFGGFSEPGDNRQLSIFNGLKDIVDFVSEGDKIIIHDAARPIVSSQTITDILNELERHEGVIPMLPMKNTVYEVEDGKIHALLDRSRVMAGQAPEGFLVQKYFQANRALLPDRIYSINGSTEVAYLAGMDVGCIQGDESNFKITTREDLERFRQIVELPK